MKPNEAKRKLLKAIKRVSENPAIYSENPGQSFSRNRKLPFETMISVILGMGGGNISGELMNYFGCRADTASASAFVQQRSKIKSKAFEDLFFYFTSSFRDAPTYKGYRLLAVDGSDIHIPTNPDDDGSYFPGTNGQKPYNLLHLNAMYDLLQNTYTDVLIQKRYNWNEHEALTDMVDRSILGKSLVIADRGYESYNNLAHIQEKGWYFLIRIRDGCSSMKNGFDLPEEDCFDVPIHLSLTRKQNNETKELLKDRNHYRFIPSNTKMDYLPLKSRKRDPAVFYKLFFRIVRFKISEYKYETVITNLSGQSFPPEELKRLYAMRWGIETSFRKLKYTIGLLNFHSKKVECICQEIYAGLTMYNFTALITAHVVIRQKKKKYVYKANFSVAAYACREFFLRNASPPDVEAVISRNIIPIRPGRDNPRNPSVKKAVSFVYRIA